MLNQVLKNPKIYNQLQIKFKIIKKNLHRHFKLRNFRNNFKFLKKKIQELNKSLKMKRIYKKL